MIELKNFVSKVLHKNDSYCILTYIDVDDLWSNEKIVSFMNEIIDKNAILKQTIIEKDNLLYLDEVKSFQLTDYYTIEYTDKANFNNYISTLLNTEFMTDSKWKFLWCVDKEANKMRYYFKIHHAYADGYKVIEILTSPEKEQTNITEKFKRSSAGSTLLSKCIGFFLLLLLNIRVFINILFNKNTNGKERSIGTDYIICNSFKFDEIKIFTKANKLTVNDFLYALMIKADRLYKNEERIITTCSPINVSGRNNTNNMCPIFNRINNGHDNSTLLKKINTTFNHFKNSLFIPVLSWLINTFTPYISLEILTLFYDSIANNSDYTFSNIIGPSIKEYKLEDIHFLTSPKNNEIVYNIISSGNNVNIICSFKEGLITDKARFEQCIYDAYDSLMRS